MYEGCTHTNGRTMKDLSSEQLQIVRASCLMCEDSSGMWLLLDGMWLSSLLATPKAPVEQAEARC